MTEKNPQSSYAIVADWLAQLEAKGYRLTAPRRAVVEIVALSQHVLTPFDIFEQAKPNHSKLGLVTVYRTLEKLEELDLVQRVHQPSGCQGFVAAFRGHQHLLICQICGRVEMFSGDFEKMETLIEEVEKDSGFSIEEHWLQLFGVCSKCQSDSC